MGTSDRAAILVVDDDVDETASMAETLGLAGYRVLIRKDGLTGLVAVEEQQPALIVLDWDLAFLTGEIFLYALGVGLPVPPTTIVLLTDGADAAAAHAAGARVSLVRPVDTGRLVREVRTILGAMPAPD